MTKLKAGDVITLGNSLCLIAKERKPDGGEGDLINIILTNTPMPGRIGLLKNGQLDKDGRKVHFNLIDLLKNL